MKNILLGGIFMKINKLKIGKGAIFICVTALTLILLYNISYASDAAKSFGEQQAKVLSDAGDGIVATIDGEKITKKGFDTYKLFLNNGNDKYSDKEILGKILDRQVVYKEALKEGVTVSDTEISNAINVAKETLSSFPEQDAAFKEYIKGLNFTEDQYWESVKSAYEKALIIGKYKNSLKDKFAKDNNITDKIELDAKFKAVYDQQVKDLENKAVIESTIK